MTDYDRIEKVIKYLDKHFLEQPSLSDLAAVVGLSESHFHRIFTRWAGTTPKSFLQFLTAKHAKHLLMKSEDLLSASLNSGLSGPSRLHDLLVSIEAVTPGEFKSKGLGVEIQYGLHDSPFGKCLIGTTKRGICHLAFIDAAPKEAISEMKQRWSQAIFKPSVSETSKIMKTIFEKKNKRHVSVVLMGTPFQLKVWEALLLIPEGQLTSYEQLATLAGSPRAARAVGSAVAQNKIAYLIPCHRVIRETGILGQYRWGALRKRALLGWEQARKNHTAEEVD